MRCKYCGSQSTELKSIRQVEKPIKGTNETYMAGVWTVECNQCASVSEYEGIEKLVEEYIADLYKTADENKWLNKIRLYISTWRH